MSPGWVWVASAWAGDPAAAPVVAPVEGEAGGAAEAPAEPTLAEKYPIEFPGQCSPEDRHFDIEILYYEGRFDEGLAEVERRLAADPSDKDLYWMKARFIFEIGERFDRKDTSIDKVAYYEGMLATVEKGLALAPGDPHLRFARGIAMGRLGTTRGILSSLFMAKTVEQDWLSVAEHPTFRYASLGGHELLPCDAYHSLGIYYRLVPDWWIVQVLAGTRGDLNKALSWNQKSVKCKPDEVQNWKELGATQLCLGTRGDAAMLEAGKASLRHALTLKAHNERARIDLDHCRKMIDDPSLACEYSRDGQQDLDESKLQK